MNKERKDDIERVFDEIEFLISLIYEDQTGKKCRLESPETAYAIGFTFKRETGCFEVEVRNWEISLHLRAEDKTAGWALAEVIDQLHQKLGHRKRHMCPECNRVHEGYDLSTVPTSAFDDLMEEIEQLSTEMNPFIERFRLRISTIAGSRASLYFAEVAKRFRKDQGTLLEGGLLAETGPTMDRYPIGALERVIEMVREHIRKNSVHVCPACNREHHH